MSEIQFDVNVANGIAFDVANDVLYTGKISPPFYFCPLTLMANLKLGQLNYI